MLRQVRAALPLLALALAPAASAADALRLHGSVPFFYYQDLPAALDWYENKLGLRKVADEGWVAIVELTPTAYLGLVNATGGTLTPTSEKAVLLSIETPDLEGWYRRLRRVKGSNITQGIKVGANGLIEEFRLQDPGGYIIEFFRWRDRPCSYQGKGETLRSEFRTLCPTTTPHEEE